LVIQDPGAYEDWRHWRYPHLLEVLQQFPSCQPDVALLASQLSPLQPRFYSISSSPRVHPGAIHITVAVVSYKAQGININKLRGDPKWRRRIRGGIA
jgi:nitric-oxide synthase, brain